MNLLESRISFPGGEDCIRWGLNSNGVFSDQSYCDCLRGDSIGQTLVQWQVPSAQ